MALQPGQMRAAIQRTQMRIDTFAKTQTDQTIYVALAQISGMLITLHDELNIYGDDERPDTDNTLPAKDD